MHAYVERVADLLDPTLNQLHGMSVPEARDRIRSGDPAAVRAIDGSFALIAKDGKTVRMARSLDRPMRYFLAKRHEGPALVVADRIDTIQSWLETEGLADQFHPSYTRMVPAHHVVTLQLIGCPDPDPQYVRFLTPERNRLPENPADIGRAYIGALADEIAKWLKTVPEREPVGVAFSGGLDSGAVFLTTLHVMRSLGMSPARLKAFTLSLDGGPDLEQARRFMATLGLDLFLEPVEADLDSLDVGETIRIIEDYKLLDVEAASMGIILLREIRRRYPAWRHLLDGDGGDENLKDYPIEENPELTIRSVLHNPLLYHEGWGVGKIKHSLTFSGGLSRSYVRTYAPARHFGFDAFSPFTRPAVVEVAEGIPFEALTRMDHERLYALKGEVIRHGVREITGYEIPAFPKRRFQHGAVPVERLRERIPAAERDLRQRFQSVFVP